MRLTDRRRGVGKFLPYDAEIEYLQSNGSQYILTNITGNARIVGSAQADFEKGSSQILIGSTSNGTGGTYFGEAASSRKWGLGTTSGTYVDLSPTTKVAFNITFSSSGASGTVNDQQINRSVNVTHQRWAIFATNNKSYQFSGKLFFVKFYQNNTLVADFIPVRIGQTGYLYDKISGQLLGNSGTDNFILGPDKISKTMEYDAEVEYLQSGGTQYIDTGIKPTMNFKCEIKAQYVQNNNGFDTMVGCYDGTNYGIALGLQSTGGGNKLYIQLGGGNSYAASGVNTTTALHTFITQLSNNTLSINVDGTTNSSTYSGNLPNMNLFLFARNKATIGNFANAKIYYCKIWNGGNLVFDAIPVRIGNVGYMYDRVSKQLFADESGSGTGFILGPDK